MRSKEAGASMVELIIATSLGVMLMVGLMSKVSVLLSLKRAKDQGVLLMRGKEALDSYLRTYGASIVASGTASGFTDPLHPTFAKLKSATFLPSYMPVTTAFDGALQFTIIKSAKNDLTGFVCDSRSITFRGALSPSLAGEVMLAAGGAGLRTSIANPGVLTGLGFPTGIPSPINAPVIVCTWSYLPSPQ